MGNVMPLEAEEAGRQAEAALEDLPEGCIANVLSFTTPRDACTLSAVSSTFRSAAQSDVVWERFLPPDYRSILSQSSPPLPPSRFPSKKDLYLHLCHNPLLIHAANMVMSFALDKLCGKKCFMLSARALSIVWGDTPIYWRWTSTPHSRFGEVAELVRVCWLEIRGRMKTRMLSPGTLYGAYLVFKHRDGGAYGFDYQPVEVSIFIVGEEGDDRRRTVYLDSAKPTPLRSLHRFRRSHRHRTRFRNIMEDHATALSPPEPVANVDPSRPRERSDGWWEVELGDFFNRGGGEDKDVDVCILEVNSGDWKGGLLLQGIEFRPKHNNLN